MQDHALWNRQETMKRWWQGTFMALHPVLTAPGWGIPVYLLSKGHVCTEGQSIWGPK